jgi:hypothetical protein
MMRWVKHHVPYMKGKSNAYKLLVGTPERKKRLENLDVSWRIGNRCKDIAHIFSYTLDE